MYSVMHVSKGHPAHSGESDLDETLVSNGKRFTGPTAKIDARNYITSLDTDAPIHLTNKRIVAEQEWAKVAA